MKASTSDLRTLLHGSTDAAFSDLVTVTLADATVARWTTDAYDLDYGGNTYTAGGTGTAPTVQRGRIRETTGLEVATMDLALGCGPASGATIGGVDIRQLAVTGRLDDARVAVQRAYMATPGGAVVGVVDRFRGVITDCEADSYEVRTRVQSDLYRLNEVLPRHLIREKCSWSLYDVGCGVNKATFTVTGTIGGSSGGTAKLIRLGWTDEDTSYNGGTLTFTSGALSGESRTVVSNFGYGPGVNWGVVVAAPFTAAPAVGSAYSISKGCDYTIATCLDRFSGGVKTNAPFTRRRGFDFVPAPDYVTR